MVSFFLSSSFLIAVAVQVLLLAAAPLLAAAQGATPVVSDPTLSGRHFRITAMLYNSYVDVQENSNGDLSFSGYLIDILEELAWRANFTYTLVTPSGYGSLCQPRLTEPNSTEAYHVRYRQQPKCGESELSDLPVSTNLYDKPDLLWGVLYVTPERLKIMRMTIPYSPPGSSATLGMFGTATHINTIHDLPSSPYQACCYENTALMAELQLGFPELKLNSILLSDDHHQKLSDGTCDVIITVYPFAKQNVLDLYKKGQCQANGKPIGVIGEPLEYGLNYFAFGVRMDLPIEVVTTLNFWLQALMACFPNDLNGYCPNGVGSLSEMFKVKGGTGQECGYVQFPEEDSKGLLLPPWAIAALVITPFVLLVAIGILWHTKQLKEQEKRMKKRFIQQLARNIDIGPSAHNITATKIAETFQHIGGQDGLISKQDLAQWMNDLHLDFLSDQDFDRLWDTMDTHDTGFVDPIDFTQFLSDCDDQFKEVHNEYSALPKSERVKLASRRLSTIKNMGQEEVENMERRNNRKSRMIQLTPSTQSALQKGNSGADPESVRSVAVFSGGSSGKLFGSKKSLLEGSAGKLFGSKKF